MKPSLWLFIPGTHIINLKKTWEKLLLAARMIVSIENPADVAVISGKSHAQVCSYTSRGDHYGIVHPFLQSS